MNKERLLKLADMLEADARAPHGIRFNLGCLAAVDEWPLDGQVRLDCGTQACAVGLAAISGEFKDAGLSYAGQRPRLPSEIQLTIFGAPVDWRSAAMHAFGLTPSEAHLLFAPGYYPHHANTGALAEYLVANRIRGFVAGLVA